MCEEYNGWTNRETWATNLWIDNERGLYEQVLDMAKTSLQEHPEFGAVACLAESIEALFDDAFSDIEEMNNAGLIMLKDIGSLYRVNWREISQGIIGELELQEVKA